MVVLAVLEGSLIQGRDLQRRLWPFLLLIQFDGGLLFRLQILLLHHPPRGLLLRRRHHGGQALLHAHPVQAATKEEEEAGILYKHFF